MLLWYTSGSVCKCWDELSVWSTVWPPKLKQYWSTRSRVRSQRGSYHRAGHMIPTHQHIFLDEPTLRVYEAAPERTYSRATQHDCCVFICLSNMEAHCNDLADWFGFTWFLLFPAAATVSCWPVRYETVDGIYYTNTRKKSRLVPRVGEWPEQRPTTQTWNSCRM